MRVSNLTLLFRDKLQQQQQQIHEANSGETQNNRRDCDNQTSSSSSSSSTTTVRQQPEFRMPLHFPKYTREEYEKMSEEEIDWLLDLYGLHIFGDLSYKKNFAMGAFLWEKDVDEQKESDSSLAEPSWSLNETSGINGGSERGSLFWYIFRVLQAKLAKFL